MKAGREAAGRRDALAAAGLFLMLLLACAYGVGLPVPQWAAGVAAWCAAGLLWPRLDVRQRQQTVLLFAIGVAALAYAAWRGGDVGLAGGADAK